MERDRGADFARSLAVGALERGLFGSLGFCVLGAGGGRGCKLTLALAERKPVTCLALTLLGTLGVGLLVALCGGHVESVAERAVVKTLLDRFLRTIIQSIRPKFLHPSFLSALVSEFRRPFSQKSWEHPPTAIKTIVSASYLEGCESRWFVDRAYRKFRAEAKHVTFRWRD